MKRLLPTYTWRQFTGDLFGGAIAALIALPYGLAMAAAMDLPPALGVLTSIVSSPVLAVLGRNPVLIAGTASSSVPFIATAVGQQGLGGAAKVGMVASVFLMAFSLLRLARHSTRMPMPVVSGFSCGVGAMMFISQLRYILSLPAPPEGWSQAMLVQLFQVGAGAGQARLAPAMLGLVVVVGASAAAKWAPKAPAPLAGVLLAVAAGRLFGWADRTIGRIPLELPDFAGFTWAPSDVWTVVPAGFALAFVTAINTLITGRVVDHFRGVHRPPKRTEVDSEIGAYGIANVLVSMFAAPISVGIPARSLANVQCGGTTRFSNFLHGVILIFCMVLGADLLSVLPNAALCGVTAWVGLSLLYWSTWRRLPMMRRVDQAAFLLTAFSTLLVNAVLAIAIGLGCYGAKWVWERLNAREEGLRQAEVRN